MDSIRANMQRATESIIQGFHTGNIDLLLSPRTPDCTQHIGPKSLNRVPKNNDEFREHVTRVYDVLKDWNFVADNVVYDVEARKSCFHATATATSPVGPYENEYSFFLWFDQSGEKISRIYEMVDSKIAGEFFERYSIREGKN